MAAPPSDGDNAFCAANANPTSLRANWVSAITIVVVTVPAVGTHTVQVKAILRNVTTENDSWSLDDSATLVTY